MSTGTSAPRPAKADQGAEGSRGDGSSPAPCQGAEGTQHGGPGRELDHGRVTACCAATYDSDLVSLLLGDAYHPGGAALTRRLASHLRLRPGRRVLDVASGPGGTALLLAREYGAQVDGVDLGERNLARASVAAAAAALADQVAFHRADAQRLPFPAASFDAVVCECAFCTFPDKPTAADEFARVLRPGGRLGVTDVTLLPGRLHQRLTGLAGWIACLADARPLAEYERLLAAAGLRVVHAERHDDALTAMIDQIEARLRALRIALRTPAASDAPAAPPVALAALDRLDPRAVTEMTALARDAVRAGSLGYGLLVAEAPSSSGALPALIRRGAPPDHDHVR